MGKNLIFIQSCSHDQYYIFQTHVWLESLKNLGYEDNIVSLIFIPEYAELNQNWFELEKLYPKAVFKYYHDKEGELTSKLRFYIPILRLFCLIKYFEENDLSDKAIFYSDVDIIFTENFKIDHLIDDDVCYVSNTHSYISSDYFDSKIKDVLEKKIEDYKKIDVLQECCSIVGITRNIAEKNVNNTGGAQYLLKNIDSNFWKKVFNDCILIRKKLLSINRQYFQNEDKGYQSWTSDMFAVLWNLWYLDKEVKVVPEMDFVWSIDPIEKLKNVGILHNAGVTGRYFKGAPMFYKGEFVKGKSPFSGDILESLASHPDNKRFVNNFYIRALINLKNKYNLK